MQNCIQDTLRENTKINDYYPEAREMDRLLICNNKEKVNHNLLKDSVLLKDSLLLKDSNIDFEKCLKASYVNASVDDRIYSRNKPSGNFIVNIDHRPLSSGRCANKKFQKEYIELEKYNKYNYSKDIPKESVFTPHKGPIKGYFDNIDMESELKNINKIDTKCSLQLFKTHPLDSNSTLHENRDLLIKDYKALEEKNGYTWDNFNQYSVLSQFTVCEEKEFPRKVTKKDICNSKEFEELNKTSIKYGNDKLHRHQSIDDAIKQKKLRDEVNYYKDKANIKRKKEIKNESPNIFTYKSKGIHNIYSPIVKKELIDEERSKLRGIRDGLKIVKDNQNIFKNKEDCPPPVCLYNIENPINLAKYNPVKETQTLYNFKSIPDTIDKDCFYCEKLFNNQTKRRHFTPRTRD
tara:strand:+ start:133 stop:1350 length:1218 start_codon:yes stop_codon:yes gene_type:complete